eukprot:gnl/TRDRNA2_/TRDRNA2_140069_c4_seq1.p1 gnl/TRDRNA2_/TRDRNA2_140069_c4~~gnl/TRDRNA2_/TRDRNA2_140069_c4_seq1.p1  ORF type:complete len:355 (-),score=83.05 gnl/TRDRNA2_/TRDRNA2_140069_c4_seq1:80-1144(-)
MAMAKSIKILKADVVRMDVEVKKVHHKMQVFLEAMCALICRKPYCPADITAATGDHQTIDVGLLNLEARTAVKDMAKVQGFGAPNAKALGRMMLSKGTGEIKCSEEKCLGKGTEFRREVKVGDVLMVEKKNYKSRREYTIQVCAVVVTRVITNTEIYVCKSQSVNLGEWESFLIAKKKLDDDEVAITDDQESTLRINSHQRPNMAPQDGQAFFEWDITTRTMSMGKLRSLENEKEMLLSEYNALTIEVNDLVKRHYMWMAWSAFRSLVEPFCMFAKDHTTALQVAYPKADAMRIGVLLRQEWAAVPPDEKEKYKVKAEKQHQETSQMKKMSMVTLDAMLQHDQVRHADHESAHL